MQSLFYRSKKTREIAVETGSRSALNDAVRRVRYWSMNVYEATRPARVLDSSMASWGMQVRPGLLTVLGGVLAPEGGGLRFGEDLDIIHVVGPLGLTEELGGLRLDGEVWDVPAIFFHSTSGMRWQTSSGMCFAASPRI